MLNKNLNYIAFDFETTGLDSKKDDAIQIGIVKFNHNFQIEKQFSSYIKPDNLENLSEIVEFTTGIKKEQLETAPSFDEIKDDILSFFDKNSVLIGHNIAFDIGFLEKYVGKVSHKYVFDTYPHSRKFLHFEPAYALEILADKYGFKGQSHDALADSIMAMELFKLIIKKIEKIVKKYPFLADMIYKSNNLLGKLLVLEKTNRKIFSIPKKGINIPKTKKVKSDTKLISSFENKTVFNVNGQKIEDVVNFCINGQNKVIFAFSSNARANVARSILKGKYLQVSSLNNGFTTSTENEKKLLGKDSFEDFEIDFIIKAFSHYLEDISVFDIANFEEYKVYKFLSDKKRNISSNFIVTTHYDLFSYIKEHGAEKIKDYSVMFFDWHNWMNSLSSVLNQGFDFYELIKKLEVLRYEAEFEKNEKRYDNLINEVSTFFGSFAVKLKDLFKNTDNKIEVVNLLEDTRNALNSIKEPYFELTEKLKKLENEEITSYWNIFQECVEHYCIIEQKLFQNGNLKYVFNPLMQNVDINTFNDFMKDFSLYNFTTLDNYGDWEIKQDLGDGKLKIRKLKQKIKQEKIGTNIKTDSETILNQVQYRDSKGQSQKSPQNLHISFIDWKDDIDFKLLVEKIKNKIEEKKSIFLVSNNKNFSNSLFKLIFNLFKEYNLEGNIYAENITGGQGKLLYYLKKDHGPKITIGGPEFLIQNKAKFISYNEVHFISIGGRNRKNTINDLYFYIK